MTHMYLGDNILHFMVVVEVEDQTDAVSDVGGNAVKDIVGMRGCLALGTGGQDGAILAEVVQLATLLDGRVIVEGNDDRRHFRTKWISRLVGVVPEHVLSSSANATDHDSHERNGSPHNFSVKIKQGVKFVLMVEVIT